MIASLGTVGFPEMIFFGVIWFIWPLVGLYVARQKRRNGLEGFLLGLLGPLGALIEALLPTKPTGPDVW